MKTKLLLVLFSCAFMQTFAQKVTVKLFDNLPKTIATTEQELGKVFDFTPNQKGTIALANNFIFKGTVISNVDQYSYMKTVMIQSTNYVGATLIFTKVTWENKITYTGRIFNPDISEGFSLQKNKLGIYELVKFETPQVIVD